MKDVTLIKLLIKIINTGLAAQGIDVTVKQTFQPTQQGAPSGPSVFVHKLFDRRIGSPQKEDKWIQGYIMSESAGFLKDENGKFVLDQQGNKIVSESMGYVLDEAGNRIVDEDSGYMQHTETQIYDSHFQINTLSIQNPADADPITAADLANTVAAILQSEICLSTLLDSDVQIYRITEVRNPYSQNDKQRFEANPSFDLILNHKQAIVTTTPVVSEFEYSVQRV